MMPEALPCTLSNIAVSWHTPGPPLSASDQFRAGQSAGDQKQPESGRTGRRTQGHSPRWRLRVGDYRVVYTIEDGRVMTVGNRRDLYRNLWALRHAPLARATVRARSRSGLHAQPFKWCQKPSLHDARHTAATVLLILGVPERVVMQIMGWSSTAMAARYQHVTGGILADVAKRVGGLIWEVAKEGTTEDPEPPA